MITRRSISGYELHDIVTFSGVAALLLFGGCAAAPVLVSPIEGQDGFVPDGYMLVWNDEFDGAGVDPERWQYDTHANARGWYNNELQYYDDGTGGNAQVRDGVLAITARREDVSGRKDGNGQQYTSARLNTSGLASWQYGFISARAKMPCGAGSWPAIWTMGENRDWPKGGEIDILEHVGIKPGIVQSNLHMPATVEGRIDNPEGKRTLPTACSAFHDYQVEYSPTLIRFFVDGVEYNRFEKDASVIGAWPFDRPQYAILNLAVGGDMGGRVEDAAFPMTFEIDHVRVYQRVGAEN